MICIKKIAQKNWKKWKKIWTFKERFKKTSFSTQFYSPGGDDDDVDAAAAVLLVSPYFLRVVWQKSRQWVLIFLKLLDRTRLRNYLYCVGWGVKLLNPNIRQNIVVSFSAGGTW